MKNKLRIAAVVILAGQTISVVFESIGAWIWTLIRGKKIPKD